MENFKIVLDDAQIAKFYNYMKLIKIWNEKFNITSVIEEKDIIIKHFIDSLSIIPFLENRNVNLIDIGTGGGLPGIPLKIVYEKLDITLLDSTEKKILFLKECIRTLGLNNIKTVHKRAEDYGKDPYYRESFDVSTARALASLPVLLEYCLPFVRLGGVFIAMKGKNCYDEIANSKQALDVLGGRIEIIKEITLPYTDNKRNIIIIRKFRQTPTKYPRKAGKPSKMPLL